MTDNEIIKALECCSNCEKGCCRNCSLNSWVDIGICQEKLIDEAYNLVNRQKAEIERLKTSPIIGTLCPMWKNEARAEAIREFAEKLKMKSELLAPSVYAEPYRAVSNDDIDNLVKEMAEEKL